jgi:hypothetical protein
LALVANIQFNFIDLIFPRGSVRATDCAPLFFTIATDSPLGGTSSFSEGKAGHVHGGDRLPWIGSTAEDNFVLLRSLRWQVHVYG